ncbi:hypothetical protein X975_23451, partial [Stegodyphus mimosarum]
MGAMFVYEWAGNAVEMLLEEVGSFLPAVLAHMDVLAQHELVERTAGFSQTFIDIPLLIDILRQMN